MAPERLISSRNNGSGTRLGGTFQNRGLLTKLSGTSGGTGASGVGATAVARNVPLPVNTSSLRKENGGQDITAVLVNRHGGKKLGWGSSLADKSTGISTDPNITATQSTDNTHSGTQPVLDPTPEEALLASERQQQESKESSSRQQYLQQSQNQGPPPSNKNTPWALNPPNQPPPSSSSSQNGYQSNFHDYSRGGNSHDVPTSNYYSGGGDYRYNSDRDGRSFHRQGEPNTSYRRRYNPTDSNDRDRDSPDNRYYYNREYNRDRDRGEYNREYIRDRDYRPHNPDHRGDRERDDNTNYSVYNRNAPSRDRPPYNPDFNNSRYNDRYYRNDERRGSSNRGGVDERLPSHYNNRGPARESNPDGEDYKNEEGLPSAQPTTRFRDFVRSERDTTQDVSSPYGHQGRSFDTYDRGEDRFDSRYDRRYGRENYRSNNNRYDSYNRDDRFYENNRAPSTRAGDPAMNHPHRTQNEKEEHSSFNHNLKYSDRDRHYFNESSTSHPHHGTRTDDSDNHADSYGYGPKRILRHDDSNNYSKDKVADEEPKQILRHADNRSNKNTLLAYDDKETHNLVSLREEQMSRSAMNKNSDGESHTSSNLSVDKEVDDDDDLSVERSVKDADTQQNNVEIEKNEQQRNVLRQVEATRADRVRGGSIDNDIPKQNHVADNNDNDASVGPEEDEEDGLTEEQKLKIKEEYLAKRLAERALRMEHRRNRKPRTRGVLFKRLPDGTLVNADLSEEEIAKRVERRSNHSDNKQGRDFNHRKKSTYTSSNTKTEPVDSSGGDEDAKSHEDEEQQEGKEGQKVYIPAANPAVSAWVAGPPPGMIKKQSAQLSSDNSNIGIINQKLNSNSNNNGNQNAKLDEVLSSSLLDIGNNGTSWSAAPSSSKPTVAVGPFMSNWSAFSGGGGTDDFQYHQSFSGAKSESPAVTGPDWSMDFALPRDLLSSAADESEEDEKVSSPTNESKKETNQFKKNRRGVKGSGRGAGPYNRRKPNNNNHEGKGSDPSVPNSTDGSSSKFDKRKSQLNTGDGKKNRHPSATKSKNLTESTPK